jgi:hypothetical protein
VLEPPPVRPVVHEPPAPVVRARDPQPTLPFEITEEP